MAMDLDNCCVDHSVLHVGLIGASFEKPNENIGFDPISVSLEDRIPTAEKGRKITPRAARTCDPQDCLNEAPVIASATARVRWFAQTMRFHLRPLGISQYESFHPKLESQTKLRRNPKSQQALDHFHVSLKRRNDLTS
jgi:hypothetical protein